MCCPRVGGALAGMCNTLVLEVKAVRGPCVRAPALFALPGSVELCMAPWGSVNTVCSDKGYELNSAVGDHMDRGDTVTVTALCPGKGYENIDGPCFVPFLS